MTNSEHRPTYFRKVMIAGIEKYDAKLKKSFLPAGDPAYKPLHSTQYNSIGSWKKKVIAREKWFKDQWDSSL